MFDPVLFAQVELRGDDTPAASPLAGADVLETTEQSTTAGARWKLSIGTEPVLRTLIGTPIIRKAKRAECFAIQRRFDSPGKETISTSAGRATVKNARQA